MMTLQLSIHIRGVDFDRLTRVYLSQEFNEALGPAIALKERRIIAHETLPDGKERWRIRSKPDVHLPTAVRKLMRDYQVQYDELLVLDRSERKATFQIRSPAGKAVRVGGYIYFREDARRTSFHFDGDVNVRVFGIGRLIERLIVSEVKRRYAKAEAFLQEYVDAGRDVDPGAMSRT